MIAFASNLPDWSALHFLRPEWLWALLALPLILALAMYRQRRSDAWRQAVDAHLLPHLLAAGAKRRVRLPWALLLGWTLASLAMAGPSWRQQAQPMFQASAPLLVVLDLSSRITATDLPPSRLLQARAKVGELLRARQGGQVGLVVYADDAYTVAPLTDDGSNVALYLDALSPDVMPRDGQRADRGIDWATRLMRQIGALQGQILLVSDQADSEAALAAAQARSLGLQVSVLGLGTPAGAAYRDGNGQIRLAALDEGSLRAVATAGGGRYARISADDGDLRALGVLDARDGTAAQRPGEGKQWRDEGFWLLPPVMLLALLAFRRRAVLAAVLAVGLLPWMNDAQAQAPATPVSQPAQGTLWKRSDQLQHQRLAEGVQAYRKGDFATARRQFEGIDSDAGWYNLANTLAREGNYDEAIAAYDRALALHPGMADAVANRAVVDAARKRRPSGGGQGQDQQKPPQNGQQKQPQGPQGQQNPQGQPKQGQQQPGQGQPPSGQQGQPKAGDNNAQSEPQPGERGRDGQQAPPQVEDAKAQAQADEQQRQRMQQAMQQAREGEAGKDGKPVPGSEGRTPRQREEQQAVEAWMRRVPDDPGALLRAKFQLENERRKREGR
ncbi:VWA domain-containing protein [Stenotrophomonas maltophilia]|uniref:VWA domain-containing protein n=1 Tax=Stenotrophomonas TaxID=40323 RepID=UPI0006217DFC|nr:MULTISPECIES: VWA domain-containing protein [unclassified Stenotrophomonas]KKF86553.1 membrane protein [Stenotrophomonas maltophilia]MBA0257276.1 VWA domain-containing protein [Stenotrophomonas maltophilia]MBA0341721.1 VWA domain-containing protein [Stenotrophomonas maltophilia]MBA0378133.1 VWA domain-containing protein [Stenotrophomonas maltophilia]MBA0406706.1 VWA domain-containing protein [Stenotrophomonas maltophilia]